MSHWCLYTWNGNGERISASFTIDTTLFHCMSFWCFFFPFLSSLQLLLCFYCRCCYCCCWWCWCCCYGCCCWWWWCFACINVSKCKWVSVSYKWSVWQFQNTFEKKTSLVCSTECDDNGVHVCVCVFLRDCSMVSPQME